MKKETKTCNARFWICYHGDWVKLTLEPGTQLAFGHSEPHEEGYSGESHTYSFDAFTVVRESYYHGRDCDGRHSETYVDVAYLAQLKDNPCREQNETTGQWQAKPGMYYPNWQKEKSERYDQYAEAAGY